MITESVRERLYQELDKTYGFRGGAKGAQARKPGGGSDGFSNLAVQWHQELTALRDQVLGELIFYLHTHFEFPAEDFQVQRAAEEALERLYALEDACRTNDAFDGHDCALILFNQSWHGPLEPRSPSLLTGVAHFDRASLFRKTLREIAGWTKRFLSIERYHRLDARESENRLDRYHALHSQLGRSRGPVLRSFDDLSLWLEYRLMGETQKHLWDVGSLSNELALELEGLVSPDILGGDALQPSIYVLLRCHQFCLAETLDAAEARHLEQLFAMRQLDSLLDLMRVVVHRTVLEHPLPEVGGLLDELREEGFNIEHSGFRDPYEAQLVPLEDTERLEMTRLSLFLPLETLSGDFEQDLALSREMMLDWHRHTVSEIIRDCEAVSLALTQPLPKAHLLHRSIRFAVNWFLAQAHVPVAALPERFLEEIRGILPEHVLRQLVRPRKGYEIKSRGELNQLIKGLGERHVESLNRVAARRRVQGLHDYAQFVRHLTFRRLREEAAGDLRRTVERAPAVIERVVLPEWVAELGSEQGIETHQTHPHTLDCVQQYLMEMVPREQVTEELGKRFETSPKELNLLYLRALDQAAPVFYRLLVAHKRHMAQLPRLPASLAEISPIVSLLAPPLSRLHEYTHQRLKVELSRSGAAFYRSQLRPYLLSSSEWKAFLAFETRKHVADDTARFLEVGDLDALLNRLEKASRIVELPPDTLFFETVQSSLLEILNPPSEDGEILPDAHLQELLTLLPQLDCAACGQPECRAFARSLLTGRAEAHQCVQLPSDRLPNLLETLKRLSPVQDGPVTSASVLDLLNDHRLWRGSREREAFRNALSTNEQRTRRLFIERARAIWENISPKPRIFKQPDSETIYGELRRYLRYEATERLQEDERLFLIEHGDERQKAEWRMLRQRQDWLTLTNRTRQSRPLLQRQDPAWMAREAYEKLLFLHQLSARDRHLVLRHRMERYQDGFSQWWNEDLLAMNLPDFSIRDWEDFSKIIRNAYWHQESSLPPEDALTILESELNLEANAPRMAQALLDQWVEIESARSVQRRTRIEKFREGAGGCTIESMDDLRDIIMGLVDEGVGVQEGSREKEIREIEPEISVQDRLALEQENLWKRFQSEGFIFAPKFSCHWEDLLPAEQESLKGQSTSGGMLQGKYTSDLPADFHSGSSPFFLSGWDEPLHKRRALILAILSSCIGDRYREDTEREWTKRTLHLEPEASTLKLVDPARSDESPMQGNFTVPVSSFRLIIKDFIRQGKDPEMVQSELRKVLDSRPELQRGLLKDALIQVILERQHALFHESATGSASAVETSAEEEILCAGFRELGSSLSTLLGRYQSMDRERLLHYLFVLSKMEGNLDVLTALLREIRETSDIIEAAWLRFTQERITEGPAPKSLPGTSLGIPLLATRIKDKEPVNRGLREGVSRREKRNVATAVNELLNFIRYHILLRMERSSAREEVSLVLRDFKDAGYDIEGVEDESLQTAILREWDRRQQLGSQKIWIYSSVIARCLAAQHVEFQEADREFYKIRMDLLKEETNGSSPYQQVAYRRGVALGQIKEEMYRQLSDLLEPERIASFQKRIRQIVDELDQKRERIYKAWSGGEINRDTFFYLLRRYQKGDQEPTIDDFERFLRDHWFTPLAELRSSQRPDRKERIHDLDDRFRAMLGTSLLELESEARVEADQDLHKWIETQAADLDARL